MTHWLFEHQEPDHGANSEPIGHLVSLRTGEILEKRIEYLEKAMEMFKDRVNRIEESRHVEEPWITRVIGHQDELLAQVEVHSPGLTRDGTLIRYEIKLLYRETEKETNE